MFLLRKIGYKSILNEKVICNDFIILEGGRIVIKNITRII